jgi:hypothetical protein
MLYYNYNNTYIHIYINEYINKLNYHFFLNVKIEIQIHLKI